MVFQLPGFKKGILSGEVTIFQLTMKKATYKLASVLDEMQINLIKKMPDSLYILSRVYNST